MTITFKWNFAQHGDILKIFEITQSRRSNATRGGRRWSGGRDESKLIGNKARATKFIIKMQNVNQIQRIMKCFDCFRRCFRCSYCFQMLLLFLLSCCCCCCCSVCKLTLSSSLARHNALPHWVFVVPVAWRLQPDCATNAYTNPSDSRWASSW